LLDGIARGFWIPALTENKSERLGSMPILAAERAGGVEPVFFPPVGQPLFSIQLFGFSFLFGKAAYALLFSAVFCITINH